MDDHFHTCCLSARPFLFIILLSWANLNLKLSCSTGPTVVLAEWIIDDSHLVTDFFTTLIRKNVFNFATLDVMVIRTTLWPTRSARTHVTTRRKSFYQRTFRFVNNLSALVRAGKDCECFTMTSRMKNANYLSTVDVWATRTGNHNYPFKTGWIKSDKTGVIYSSYPLGQSCCMTGNDFRDCGSALWPCGWLN